MSDTDKRFWAAIGIGSGLTIFFFGINTTATDLLRGCITIACGLVLIVGGFQLSPWRMGKKATGSDMSREDEPTGRKGISDDQDEWVFTNQNWKRVLDEISRYVPNRYGRGKQDYGEDHPLVKRLKIAPHELMLVMSFLEEQGLIEYEKPECNWIHLTSKGFDVNLQNQRTASTRRISQTLLLLSAVIALTAIASLLIGIENPIVQWLVVIILSIAIVAVARSIRKM